jgi:hypothetical protein
VGLDDRDYMQERRDAPFTPPPDVGISTFLAVALVCALVLGGYKAYGWYQEGQALNQRQLRSEGRGGNFPSEPSCCCSTRTRAAELHGVDALCGERQSASLGQWLPGNG